MEKTSGITIQCNHPQPLCSRTEVDLHGANLAFDAGGTTLREAEPRLQDSCPHAENQHLPGEYSAHFAEQTHEPTLPYILPHSDNRAGHSQDPGKFHCSETEFVASPNKYEPRFPNHSAHIFVFQRGVKLVRAKDITSRRSTSLLNSDKDFQVLGMRLGDPRMKRRFFLPSVLSNTISVELRTSSHLSHQSTRRLRPPDRTPRSHPDMSLSRMFAALTLVHPRWRLPKVPRRNHADC